MILTLCVVLVQPMKRHYAELFKLNNQLVADYVKRANNHQALLDALKEVNFTIQKSANLRMGGAKTRVRVCRELPQPPPSEHTTDKSLLS
jgi:hypothetical protein